MTNGTTNGKDVVGRIIQGGAVGIALVSVILNYKLISNHMTHSLEAQVSVQAAVQANTKALDQLSSAVNGLESFIQISNKANGGN